MHRSLCPNLIRRIWYLSATLSAVLTLQMYYHHHHLGSKRLISAGSRSRSSSNGRITNKRLCTKGSRWCVTLSASKEIIDNSARLAHLCPWPINQTSWILPAKTAIGFMDWSPSVHIPSQKRPYSASDLHAQRVDPGYDTVGSWNESFQFLAAQIRCGHKIAVARFGDGELSVLSGQSYQSNIDLSRWVFNASHAEFVKFRGLITDAFRLAAEMSAFSAGSGGIHLGLPIYFCMEGIRNFRFGGGGVLQWLKGYIFAEQTQEYFRFIKPQRMVHSWLWGNLNYPATINLVHEVGRYKRVVLVCNEEISHSAREKLPEWAHMVLTVPSNGIDWFMSNLDNITSQAARVAASVDDHVFLFSAGPMSNALIPLMWRANSRNTYLDLGGALDFEIHGKKTRDFHPDGLYEEPDSLSWLTAVLVNNQRCRETRWRISSSKGFFDKNLVMPASLESSGEVDVCMVDRRLYECEKLDKFSVGSSNDPSPLPRCMSGLASWGICQGGAFLCESFQASTMALQSNSETENLFLLNSGCILQNENYVCSDGAERRKQDSSSCLDDSQSAGICMDDKSLCVIEHWQQ